MKNKKANRLIGIVLWITILFSFSQTSATNLLMSSKDSFLGNWSLVLPNGAAVWFTVYEEGILKAEFWTVGTPHITKDLELKGNTLFFKRLSAVGKPEYPGGKPTGPSTKVQLRAFLDGDVIYMEQDWPLADGTIKTQWFCGKRLPALPSKPDLSKIEYGESVELFNGKDLIGWRLTNPDQINGWKVEDGVLVNETPKLNFDPFSKYGNLRTDQEFMDFNLKLEFNVPVGGNSGIYLKGRYEVQVVDRDSRMQGLQGVGALFARIKPSENAGKPGGEWQTYDITFVDQHVTVILNGKKVIDNQLVEGATKGALSTDDTASGPIYFQGDHTAVIYRNIVLRPVIKH